ncbi:MAG: ABC transporter ATP-binding protein [Roseburia sp.]|nr:ABC transporter ATP-binding protein [Roseburia sp.]
MKPFVVKTQNLQKYYKSSRHTVKALDGVNFTVAEQEFVSIIGKSGSGKSTLLHLIGGLDTPTGGEIYVNGIRLNDMGREELAVFRRRKIGFIFQNYNLVPDLNVYENIILPVELDGRKPDKEFIRDLLSLLQLKEKIDALPGNLSGGQQQRVAIARAVASKPGIILADEPTGNLDTAASHDVMGLLKTVAKQYAQTILLITHDYDIAQLADRIVQIEDGKIVRGGDFLAAQ